MLNILIKPCLVELIKNATRCSLENKFHLLISPSASIISHQALSLSTTTLSFSSGDAVGVPSNITTCSLRKAGTLWHSRSRTPPYRTIRIRGGKRRTTADIAARRPVPARWTCALWKWRRKINQWWRCRVDFRRHAASDRLIIITITWSATEQHSRAARNERDAAKMAARDDFEVWSARGVSCRSRCWRETCGLVAPRG